MERGTGWESNILGVFLTPSRGVTDLCMNDEYLKKVKWKAENSKKKNTQKQRYIVSREQFNKLICLFFIHVIFLFLPKISHADISTATLQGFEAKINKETKNWESRIQQRSKWIKKNIELEMKYFEEAKTYPDRPQYYETNDGKEKYVHGVRSKVLTSK